MTSKTDMDLSQGISSTVSGVRDGTRWRKKPVEVEAVCYTAEIASQGWPFAITDALPWLDEAYDTGVLANIAELNEKGAKPRFINCRLRIATPEGPMHASPGDWIIRGVKGELYACKPDVFALTYEPADTSDRPTQVLGSPQDKANQ